MKKIILILTAIVTMHYCAQSQEGRAKKPTLMVVPSDNWCIENGFTQKFDNQGKIMNIPDYKRALQESFDLISAIAKINEMMTDRGFPLKNLESSLKSLENQSVEDAMLSSQSGSEIVESPIDKLKKVARADIWIQISWKANTVGPKKSVSFILQGLDAYTDKQIAGASGTGEQSFTAEFPILLEEAVLTHIDNFNSQLQSHFDDMFENGREVVLGVSVFDSWGENLESEFGSSNDELSNIIENWVNDNTVQHRFNTSDATENRMLFEQVRIPLFDEKGKPIDTRNWARGLQKYLKDNFQITAKLIMKGLGQAQLILGEK
ncbi:MAG: DUF6175 family protein [Bacteroidales bacterium]|jgi:hypothetical protein|nr:DUF6175 family protein [Bacteroidales bacterium]